MRLVHILFVSFLIAISSCKDDDTNQLTVKSKNLDSNLRKALLKALTELETEDDGKSTSNAIEKAAASAISFVDTYENLREDASSKDTSSEHTETKKQLVVIQKSSGLQHKPITSFIPSGFNKSEHLLASASNSLTTRKYETSSPNSINDKLSKIDLTSPTPTVETPTTEENEAKVEDVQFFSAPLVAAFTVHQDERGIPKSVEPIFKSATNVLPVVTNYVDDQKYYQQELYRQDQLKQQEQLRNQLVIQEKQRALEEQVYVLQKQQREQQEFLFKQQQLIREQERKLLEERERNRLKNNEQPFLPIIPSHINSNKIEAITNFRGENNQFTTQNPLKSTVVSFQSSVSLNPIDLNKSNQLPLSAQQLPVKNFIDFRQSPYVQTFNQIESVLKPPHAISGHHFNFATNIDIPPIQNGMVQNIPSHNIRIYRQEPSAGNFINDFSFSRPPHQFGNVAIQPSIQLSNVRLLRSNAESFQSVPGTVSVHPPVVNQHLRNLLHQAGISKGRQEDFNIVSKVLSYNHFGGDNFFAGPRSFTPIHRSDGKV